MGILIELLNEEELQALAQSIEQRLKQLMNSQEVKQDLIGLHLKDSTDLFDEWTDWVTHSDYFFIDLNPKWKDRYCHYVEHRQPSDFEFTKSRPIYAYMHGGVTVSLSPFSCRWDSCQVGRIFYKDDYNPKWPIEELDAILNKTHFELYHHELDYCAFTYCDTDKALEWLLETTAFSDKEDANKWLTEQMESLL